MITYCTAGKASYFALVAFGIGVSGDGGDPKLAPPDDATDTTVTISAVAVAPPNRLQALPELTFWPEMGQWAIVRGERFLREHDPDLGLVLMHPIWSLMGHGATEADATADLERDAKAIAEELSDPDFPFALDAETERLRDYAVQFLE